jgi:two-component system chemotaxis response regulator CheB
VAIGISADGIGSLDAVLGGLPADFPAPVLIVIHRRASGAAGGSLERILARRSTLPVREPASGEVLQAGTVYLAPADVHLIVRDGRIDLEQSPKVAFSRPSIDVLFNSVARIWGPRAIGVLLSGYGRDGVKGLQAIKARGGTTIVQDPGDTRFGHLPRAAMQANGVDLVLPLRDVAGALTRLVVSELPERLREGVETAMTPKAVVIFDDLPLSEVRSVAAKYDYNAFPIVDRDSRLVGMVTKGDLLRAAVASLGGADVWSEPARQWMAHGVLALRPADSLGTAVECLLASKHHSLPVIDDDSRVIGMVSRNDLMRAIGPSIS